MLVTVDIGNTTISLCGLERGGGDDYDVRFTVKMATDPTKDGTAYLAEIRSLLAREGVNPAGLDGAVLCSVVPVLTEPLRSCVRSLTGTEPVCLTAESDTGLVMRVPEPRQVGLDRIADAAWAAARCPLPVVTVDMGTATTFNVVDEGAVFLGGLIAPGLETGLHALSRRAAQLPEIQLSTPDSVIGKTTAECMCSGSVTGAAAMVDGITARIEHELGKQVTLVMTGGLALHVEPLCLHPHLYEPDLLPKGLAVIYERTVGAPTLRACSRVFQIFCR